MLSKTQMRNITSHIFRSKNYQWCSW